MGNNPSQTYEPVATNTPAPAPAAEDTSEKELEKKEADKLLFEQEEKEERQRTNQRIKDTIKLSYDDPTIYEIAEDEIYDVDGTPCPINIIIKLNYVCRLENIHYC